MEKLTYEAISRLLSYDPETGLLRWSVNRPRGVKAGDVAGCLWKTTGYWRVSILGRAFGAHRLAWLLTHGVWPEQFIDHINGDPSDNRLSNLRAATNSQNQANRKVVKTASNVKGVTWNKHCGKWQAAIKKNGKNHHLGVFEKKTDASEAYAKAAKLLFGDFAA